MSPLHTDMTRAEHLAWAKERALEYIYVGEIANAIASMQSDLRKHPELKNHGGLLMGTMLMMNGHMKNAQECRKWIEGFN